MESLFQSLGMSFTWSKFLPYIFMVLLGALAALFFYRKTSLKPLVKKSLAVLVFLLPLGLYFALNPIYEGDFNRDGASLSIRNAKTAEIQDGLLVIAIPGCPYCLESIGEMKKMKKANPKLAIHFMVTGSNDPRNLIQYKEEAKGNFPIGLLENTIALLSETGDNFPTFIRIKDGQAVEAWTNNDFGVRAKDKVLGQ